MIKWAAVRGHLLLKIRNMQLYAFDDLPGQGFCGLMVSKGLAGNHKRTHNCQLMVDESFLTVSFLPSVLIYTGFCPNPPLGIVSVKSPVPLSHQSPSSLSLSYAIFGSILYNVNSHFLEINPSLDSYDLILAQ